MQAFHITAPNNTSNKHSRINCQTNNQSTNSIGFNNKQPLMQSETKENKPRKDPQSNLKQTSNSKSKYEFIRNSSHSPY